MNKYIITKFKCGTLQFICESTVIARNVDLAYIKAKELLNEGINEFVTAERI